MSLKAFGLGVSPNGKKRSGRRNDLLGENVLVGEKKKEKTLVQKNDRENTYWSGRGRS